MESNETLSFDMDTAGVERQARAAAAALNGLKQAAVSLGGAVTAALLGTQALADSADNAAAAEKTLAKTSTAAAKAVQRALAGFDELEILKFSGSGTSTAVTAGETVIPNLPDTVTASAQPIMDKLLSLLGALDFSPAAAVFARLGEAVKTFTAAVAPGLEWAWENILTPLASWIIEQAVPASVDVLTAAFSALTAALTPVRAGVQSLLTVMEPVFAFLGGAAVTALEGLKALFESLAQTFTARGGTIQSALAAVGDAISALWSRLEPILNNWMTVFSAGFSYLSNLVTTWAGLLTDAFCGLAVFLSGAFTGDWSRAWSGITAVFSGAKEAIAAQAESLKAFLAQSLPAIAANASLAFQSLGASLRAVFSGLPAGAKEAVNGVIGYVNRMLQTLTAGVNAVIRGINSLSFTVPGWVPGLGGSKLGFNLQTVSCPQIPYLAQGAVLPANKPFLAMVGDQKSGTNVEAPLATIQEAVANVLDDQLTAMMAGFEAVVQAIREKDSSVVIGDDVIYGAAQRQQAKLALARGGGL